MNSLVAQQQGYTFPMDEIPRTYYPGRGFLSDQEAYPEKSFLSTTHVWWRNEYSWCPW